MNSTQGHTSIVLLGGGGHAAVVADAARSAGLQLVGYVDDVAPQHASERLSGLTYLGTIADVPTIISAMDKRIALHAAVGDNATRERWLQRLADHPLATVLHYSAIIAPDAVIERGCFIGPGAIVNSRARIEAGAIVNSAAVVEHDCRVGRSAHIAPRVLLCGGVDVGAGALIGAAAVVIPGRQIGAYATVGAGAVVIDDVDAGATVVGTPARPLAATAS